METNSDVSLGCPKYPKKQSVSAEGGVPAEQHAEPGNTVFTNPKVVGGSQAAKSGALSSSGYRASAYHVAELTGSGLAM